MVVLAGAPWSNTHAFVSQSFIHELATEAKPDHLEFLIEMKGEPRWLAPDNIRSINTGRAIGVIQEVAAKIGWGRSIPAGRGLGLAFYFCHAAHVAEIAEVSVDKDNKLTLHKVWAAVDVGPIINMSGAITQVQGAIIDGFSTMIGQKITMENGRIEQTNLHQYPILRIDKAPEVDVRSFKVTSPRPVSANQLYHPLRPRSQTQYLWRPVIGFVRCP